MQRLDLYRQAAEALGIEVPALMRSATLIDGCIWDGSDPAEYARSFPIHSLAGSARAIAL
ncbi:hypothetical protein D3C85_973910 [compost metagenome]